MEKNTDPTSKTELNDKLRPAAREFQPSKNKIATFEIRQILPYLVLALVLVAFAWFIFWQAGQAEDTLTNTNNIVELAFDSDSLADSLRAKTSKLSQVENQSKSDLVYEFPQGKEAELIMLGDEGALVDLAPSSFIDYIKLKLQTNNPDDDGCVLRYTLNKISHVNISGSIGSASPKENPDIPCGGGAGVVWYFQDDVWNQTDGFQDWPPCSWLNEAKIYKEFIQICGRNNDGENVEITNPNGSIDDANI